VFRALWRNPGRASSPILAQKGGTSKPDCWGKRPEQAKPITAWIASEEETVDTLLCDPPMQQIGAACRLRRVHPCEGGVARVCDNPKEDNST